VIQVIVPPLRDCPHDILPMARFFIQHHNANFKRQIDDISLQAEMLLTHPWPGNVLELRHAIERAMILEDTGYIQAPSLPIAVRGDFGDARAESRQPLFSGNDPMPLLAEAPFGCPGF
jgi:two-component system response regulator HydG